jgi:hypothetical protein
MPLSDKEKDGTTDELLGLDEGKATLISRERMNAKWSKTLMIKGDHGLNGLNGLDASD